MTATAKVTDRISLISWLIGAAAAAFFALAAGCQSAHPEVAAVETVAGQSCFGCHTHEFVNSSKPPHKVLAFSQDCASCHSQDAWHPASGFDHQQIWPLTGAHEGPACAACHGDFQKELDSACVACHLSDYNSAKAPDHVAQNTSKLCQNCHSTAAWKPALAIDHDQFYPLTGKHKTAACQGCHTAPGVKPPKVCSSCHLPAYTASTNPSHTALGLPTSCETCHTTAGWKPAGFPNHPFPITSGKHKLTCAQCHNDSGNFAAFSCLSGSCHTASKTNSQHQGEDGYLYSSAACLNCHPDGKE